MTAPAETIDILPALKGEDSHVGILRFADYPFLWGHLPR